MSLQLKTIQSDGKPLFWIEQEIGGNKLQQLKKEKTEEES